MKYEALFRVEIALPFAWQSLPDEAAECPDILLGNQLLLSALNAMEMPENAEQNKAQERLESKLDLALHWLGQVLHEKEPKPALQNLRLDSEGLSWCADTSLSTGQRVQVVLYPSHLLAGPLRLPMRIAEHEGEWVRGTFLCPDEGFQNAWSQWLFRRHRREIQARRGGNDAPR